MPRFEVSFDTDRPMDPTAWPDYLASIVLLGFYVFLAFCVVITVKASTQARVSLALKDPFWINIMYLGSLLSATGLFISNRHLDILDPVRNIHCALWDYWVLMGGFTLWIAFWISSLITSRVRQSGFALTASGIVEYDESDIVPTFTYDHDVQEMMKDQYMDEYDGDEKRLSRRPLQAEAILSEVDLLQEDGDAADEAYIVVPYHHNFGMDNSTRLPRSCWCKPCRAASECVSHWWWTRTTINTRLGLFRTLCGIVLIGIYLLVCIIAEIPGSTWFHEELNACMANFYFKLFVVAILVSYLVVSWTLYYMMTRRAGFLPANTSAFLFAANYRNALLAMTVALSIMIGLNMASLLSVSAIRSVYFSIFIALLVYGIHQMIGQTAWECLKGTYALDREIEESLRRLDMPRNFTDVVSDPAYIPVLHEFHRYVREEERGRMYLADRKKLEYRGHGSVVVLPGYICRWNPEANRYANADQNYPMFLDLMVDLHEAIWLRKRNLSDTAGQLAASSSTDRTATDIFKKYFTTTGRSYEALCHDHPQRIDTFKGTIPLIPMDADILERLKNKLLFHPMDLTVFQEISEYLDHVLQAICWTKFFNDGRTMRHLREATVVQTELIQSLASNTTGARQSLRSDAYGEDIVVDRQIMVDMPSYYERSEDCRPADANMASFSIDDEDEDEDEEVTI